VQFYRIATYRRNGFFYWLNFKRKKRYACDAESKNMGNFHPPSNQERADNSPGDVKRKRPSLYEIVFIIHVLVKVLDLVKDLL